SALETVKNADTRSLSQFSNQIQSVITRFNFLLLNSSNPGVGRAAIVTIPTGRVREIKRMWIENEHTLGTDYQSVLQRATFLLDERSTVQFLSRVRSDTDLVELTTNLFYRIIADLEATAS